MIRLKAFFKGIALDFLIILIASQIAFFAGNVAVKIQDYTPVNPWTFSFVWDLIVLLIVYLVLRKLDFLFKSIISFFLVSVFAFFTSQIVLRPLLENITGNHNFSILNYKYIVFFPPSSGYEQSSARFLGLNDYEIYTTAFVKELATKEGIEEDVENEGKRYFFWQTALLDGHSYYSLKPELIFELDYEKRLELFLTAGPLRIIEYSLEAFFNLILLFPFALLLRIFGKYFYFRDSAEVQSFFTDEFFKKQW